ncbi:hypothetical protein GW17_00042250 [Ensete ventricosum]|nr:hypothetical protein GW17_00042250 [Ensete ventricosum]
MLRIIMFRLLGFTKFSRADYLKWKSENRIVSDGVNAKVRTVSSEIVETCLVVQLLGCHGPLANRRPGKAFLPSAVAETS